MNTFCEIRMHRGVREGALGAIGSGTSQGSGARKCQVQVYLAHKKLPPPRTLQQDYAQGPMVVIRGGRFLMSEVPL